MGLVPDFLLNYISVNTYWTILFIVSALLAVALLGALTHQAAAVLLPVRHALRLYSEGSAWFTFEDGERGSLAPGRLADLAVLDKDYLTVPEGEIGTIVSLRTMVGGRIVYGDGPFMAYEEKAR